MGGWKGSSYNSGLGHPQEESVGVRRQEGVLEEVVSTLRPQQSKTQQLKTLVDPS